jgi:hypothetical protein
VKTHRQYVRLYDKGHRRTRLQGASTNRERHDAGIAVRRRLDRRLLKLPFCIIELCASLQYGGVDAADRRFERDPRALLLRLCGLQLSNRNIELFARVLFTKRRGGSAVCQGRDIVNLFS